MKQVGFSASDIAREVGVTEPTVYKWCRRWEEKGNLRDPPKSGAPKKTSELEDQRILAVVAENYMTTAVEIRDHCLLTYAEVSNDIDE